MYEIKKKLSGGGRALPRRQSEEMYIYFLEWESNPQPVAFTGTLYGPALRHVSLALGSVCLSCYTKNIVGS